MLWANPIFLLIVGAVLALIGLTIWGINEDAKDLEGY